MATLTTSHATTPVPGANAVFAMNASRPSFTIAGTFPSLAPDVSTA